VSPARQIVRGENETLDAPILGQRFDDLRHIGQRHATVEKMIWLDEDADAARALIETARFAGARAEFREAARLNLLLQSGANFLRPAISTRAFWVIIRSPIRADKEVAPPQSHEIRSAMGAAPST
jgi:hypothetical protein